MKTLTWKHADGTTIIEFTAETPEDHIANNLLFCRYDGTGLIGSGGNDGAYLQLLVVPLTPNEVRENARLDEIINQLGRSRRQSNPEQTAVGQVVNYVEV